MKENLREYDVQLDSKNRIALNNPKFNEYHAVQKKNGTLILIPKVDDEPFVISKKTLGQINRSIQNVKKGNVYGPVNLKIK